MNKKSIKILELILKANGNCDERTPEDCRNCPLNSLKEGMGCIEALDIEGLSQIDADARYMAAAMAVLADVRLDEILGETDGAE